MTGTECVNKFHDLVEELIQLNHEHRKMYFNRTYPLITFFKEFCIVKIDCGRQIGKTEYIRSHATNEDLIIVPHGRDQSGYNYDATYDKLNIIRMKDVFQTTLIADRRYNTIYVDEIVSCQGSMRHDLGTYNIITNQIYDNYIRDEQQTLVLFG